MVPFTDREAARKHHIQNVLMKRTPQQLEEEEFLYIESRRIEQQYSQMSREREELWRTLCGVGPQSTSALALNSPFLSPAARENAATAAGLSNKKRRRGELDMLEDPNNTGQKVASTSTLPQLAPAQDEQYGITRFDASTPASSVTRPSGVYLRSSKPPQLKTSLAPKIIAALAEQGISMRLAMPTRQNMEKLEALVSAITSLLDCKKQVERAEYEVKVLKTRKEASMRIEEEDRAIKAQEDEEARRQRDASALASTGEGLTPQRETSSTASSMQVDA
jgi:DNA methyltransferase 1-associated protein 1